MTGKPVPARLRLFGWWPTVSEWRVLIFDVRMRLSGICNDAPYPRGGYIHWRCQRGHGHPGAHRFRNYVWGPGTKHAWYSPLPTGFPFPNGDPTLPGFGMSFAQRRAQVRLTRRGI